MGVIVAELCEVVEVRSVSDGSCVGFKDDVTRLRKMEKVYKISFYDEIKNEWEMYSADDFNGHVSRHVDGLDCVYGG